MIQVRNPKSRAVQKQYFAYRAFFCAAVQSPRSRALPALIEKTIPTTPKGRQQQNVERTFCTK